MSRFQRQARKHPRLAQRARRQGRIATGPDRRAAQRQIGHIRSQRRKDIGRIQRQGQGAARADRKTANRQAAYERGISTKGLGPYAKMTRHQLQAGANQVERYGKGLATISRKAASQGVRAVKQASREDIYNTQESVQGIQHQATAQVLSDLVSARRQTQRDAAQEQAQKQLDKLKAQRGRQRDRLQDAYGAVGDLLKTDPVPPQNEKEWSQFAQAVQSQNPLMSPRAVEAAIQRYRSRQGHRVLKYWANALGI